MAVSKSEKQTLSKMWNKASSSTSNVVAGKYIFKIESAKYNDGDKGPSIREILKVTGGNEEFIGETVSVFNNLSTEQNMSFFKQKLQRLGIDIPEDFTEIEDGTVCEEMEGITFEGELKIKNGFVNVYVNRLVDADDEDDDSDEDEDNEEEDSKEGKDAEEPEDSEDEEDEEESDEEEEEEDEDDADEEDSEEEESEEDSAEESEEDDDAEEEESDDSEEEDEEDNDDGEGEEFPTPDEVAAMKAKQVNEVLKAIDLDPKEIASPKKVLEGISNYLYTKKYVPEIDVFNMVVKALNIKGLKGKSSVEKNKAVKQAVENLLS